jgi:hypothetical protein
VGTARPARSGIERSRHKTAPETIWASCRSDNHAIGSAPPPTVIRGCELLAERSPQRREDERHVGKRQVAGIDEEPAFAGVVSANEDWRWLCAQRRAYRNRVGGSHSACRFSGTTGLPMPLYRQATEAFGERGLMEITAIVGFYTLISMTLNAFEVEVAPGVQPPFARDP